MWLLHCFACKWQYSELWNFRNFNKTCEITQKNKNKECDHDGQKHFLVCLRFDLCFILCSICGFLLRLLHVLMSVCVCVFICVYLLHFIFRSFFHSFPEGHWPCKEGLQFFYFTYSYTIHRLIHVHKNKTEQQQNRRQQRERDDKRPPRYIHIRSGDTYVRLYRTRNRYKQSVLQMAGCKRVHTYT